MRWSDGLFEGTIILAKIRGNGIACLKSSKLGRFDKTLSGRDNCPDQKLAGTVGGINWKNG
jgi:hypothetical protein